MLSPTEVVYVATATGRSGTTLLMAVLDNHKRIVLERGYPCEFRLCQELLHETCQIEQALSYPFSMGVSAIEDQLRVAIIEGDPRRFYEHLAFLQGKQMRYIAEKMVGLEFDLLQKGQARFLLTLRDPRDIYLSIRAFDKKRGSFGFGLNESHSVRAAAEILYRDMAIIPQLLARSDTLLVRYDELILQPKRAADQIFGWLGVSAVQDLTIDDHVQHRTSSDAASSVFRWKDELTSAEKATFVEVFGKSLDAF